MIPKKKYEYVIIRNDKEIGLNEYGFDYLIDLEHTLNIIREENQQLKLTNRALSGCLKIDKEKIDYYVDRCEQLEKVLDEIREYISNYNVFKEFSFPLMKRDEENQVKSSIDYEFQTSIKNSLLQILDKVKE